MFEGKSLKPNSGQNTGSRKRNAGIGKKPDNLPDRTLRCRHELKYHISESTAEGIAQFIKPYIPLDRYCKLHRSRDYPSARKVSEDFKTATNYESAVTPTNRIILAFLRLSAG